MKEMLAEEFKTASASKDIVRFLHAVQSYAFFKVRYSEIGVTDTIDANDDVRAAYNKYVVDLIPRIKTHRTFKETLELGGIIYDRMKDMIREAMEKKTPPPPKPEPAGSKDKETEDENRSDDGSGDEDSKSDNGSEREEELGQEKEKLDDKNDNGDTEGTKKSSDESDADPNKETETEDDNDDSDEGTEENPKETSDKQDADKNNSGGHGEDPESDDTVTETSEGTGEPEERNENEGEDEPNESSPESDEDDDTTTHSDNPTNNTDSEAGEGDEDADERGDKSSSEDEDVLPPGEEKPSCNTHEPEESNEDVKNGDNTDDGTDQDEPDPVGDYEDAQREWEDKIVKAVEGVLREVEDRADELKTVHDENKETIEEHSADYDSPYMVHPDVKDIIEYNRSTYLTEAEMIKNRGLQMLGTAGARLTRLFVAQSYPRHIHNQYHGRFDMRSYMSDTMDKRTDIYSRKMGARLDKAAVSLMVDNSASMMACIGAIYCILSGLLHYLGKARIPTEVVGFTAGTAKNGDYRDVPVHLTIVKKFEDLYDSAVMQRCVQPSHMEQNAEVDCLRYMVPRLMARPETKKVLFILGDGNPCIGNDRLSEKLAAAYKEYIELCKEAGIIVFGFGIGCNLRWVFGEDFVSVGTSDVGDQLLTKLTEVLSRPTVHVKRLAA
jgi:hypothetical protein